MPEVVFVGANPGLLLRAADESVAFASVWQVDWSPAGRGRALVLCRDGRTLAFGADERLCRWLVERFTRHFPESADTGGRPEYASAEVAIDIDVATGMRATAAGVVVELSQPLDRRVFRADRLALGGTAYALSNVFVPCATGSITVHGTRLPGRPTVSSGDEPASSGFLAVAEVWTEV